MNNVYFVAVTIIWTIRKNKLIDKSKFDMALKTTCTEVQVVFVLAYYISARGEHSLGGFAEGWVGLDIGVLFKESLR